MIFNFAADLHICTTTVVLSSVAAVTVDCTLQLLGLQVAACLRLHLKERDLQAKKAARITRCCLCR